MEVSQTILHLKKCNAKIMVLGNTWTSTKDLTYAKSPNANIVVSPIPAVSLAINEKYTVSTADPKQLACAPIQTASATLA